MRGPEGPYSQNFLDERQDKGNPDVLGQGQRLHSLGYLGSTFSSMDTNPNLEKLGYSLAQGMFDASRLQNLEQK